MSHLQERNSADSDVAARLQESYFGMYAQLCGKPAPPVSIRFYPYVNLKHTIRVRQGRVLIRISDILRGAPQDILEATLALLLCKLLKKELPARHRRRYREFVRQSAVRARIRRVRGSRGRKQLTSPRGKTYDLSAVFAKLNRLYFEDRLRIRHLSWSPRRGRHVLGHYDPAHQAILINPRLDHPLVPAYVVEFVLYHEMLHAFLGEEDCGGRRSFHHRSFREAERRFKDFRRARRFIDRELC